MMLDGISRMLGRGPKTKTELVDRATERWVHHDNEGAIRDLDQAIALDLRDPQPNVLRGHALSDMERFDEARAAYDAALRVDPRCPDAYTGRSVLHLAQDRPDEAILDASRSIDLASDELHPMVTFNALATRARAYIEREAYDLARADAETVIERHPMSSRGWWYRGLARRGLGDLDGAIADLGRAVEVIESGQSIEQRKGWLVEVLVARAGALYDRAYRDESAPDLVRSAADGQRLIELAPGMQNGYSFVGMAFAGLEGHEATAVRYLEEARRRTTDPEVIAMIQSNLDLIAANRSEEAPG